MYGQVALKLPTVPVHLGTYNSFAIQLVDVDSNGVFKPLHELLSQAEFDTFWDSIEDVSFVLDTETLLQSTHPSAIDTVNARDKSQIIFVLGPHLTIANVKDNATVTLTAGGEQQMVVSHYADSYGYPPLTIHTYAPV